MTDGRMVLCKSEDGEVDEATINSGNILDRGSSTGAARI